MDLGTLEPWKRRIRQAIRDFLLIATPEELQREKKISLERNDTFRAECIQELIDEI